MNVVMVDSVIAGSLFVWVLTTLAAAHSNALTLKSSGFLWNWGLGYEQFFSLRFFFLICH